MTHETLPFNPLEAFYSLNPATYFKEAPKREVRYGERKAELRPSPSDIPSSITVKITCNNARVSKQYLALARLDYPSDSEPEELFEQGSHKVYVGRRSGRVMSIETPIRNNEAEPDFRKAIIALAEAVKAVYDFIPNKDRASIRKELNNKMVRRIFELLAEKQERKKTLTRV